VYPISETISRTQEKQMENVTLDIEKMATDLTTRIFQEANAKQQFYTESHMQWIFRENCKMLAREARLKEMETRKRAETK